MVIGSGPNGLAVAITSRLTALSCEQVETLLTAVVGAPLAAGPADEVGVLGER